MASFDYYRIFYYVAKYESFSKAAQVLENNQPNITRCMNNLEHDLCCKLFIRSNRGVSLTPEGENLYKHISIAMEHIFAGEEEITSVKTLHSGTITITCSEIALHCALLPVLKQFHQIYPKIRIRVLNHTTPQAARVLKNGLADFAVVTTPLPLSDCFCQTVLKQIQEVPVCSMDQDIPTCLTWNALSSFPVISLTEQTNSYGFYEHLFHSFGLTFKPEIEVATADQILPMVESDLGIGFVPTEFLNMKKEPEHLKVLTLNPPIPKRDICLLKLTGKSLSIAAKKFEEMLTASCVSPKPF